MAKKTWKDRLVKEEKKLNKKVDALASFIEGEYGKFDELFESDKDLLMTQHAAMTAYLNILALRMKKHGLMKCEQCEKKKKSFEQFLDMLIKDIDPIKDDEDGRNS